MINNSKRTVNHSRLINTKRLPVLEVKWWHPAGKSWRNGRRSIACCRRNDSPGHGWRPSWCRGLGPCRRTGRSAGRRCRTRESRWGSPVFGPRGRAPPRSGPDCWPRVAIGAVPMSRRRWRPAGRWRCPTTSTSSGRERRVPWRAGIPDKIRLLISRSKSRLVQRERQKLGNTWWYMVKSIIPSATLLKHNARFIDIHIAHFYRIYQTSEGFHTVWSFEWWANYLAGFGRVWSGLT